MVSLFSNQQVQRLCAIHENQQCTFLCTDPSRTDCAFKCDFCVVDQTLQSKNLIPIAQIQNSNSKTVFWHWPLPEDSELMRRIKALSVRPKTDAKYKERIDIYFKELRIEILAKIDSVQKQMCKQSEQLWDFDDRILGQYNVFSAKETLKEIVFDSQTEMDQLSLKVRETTAGVVSCKEATKLALEASLSQLDLQESAVDFEGPTKIKEQILEKLSSISMFLVEDMRDLAAEMQDQEQEALENLDSIVSLATSKLNSTTERFQTQLKRQLLKFGRVLQKVDLGNVKEERKRVDELAMLDEGEIEEVQCFVSALIESKQKRMEGNDVGDNMRKRGLQVSDIVQLVKCKANHVSDEAIQQIQRMLENIKRYIETFQVQTIYIDGYQQERFDNLNDSEIKRSQILAQELKDLLREEGNNQQCLQELCRIGQQMCKAQQNVLQPEGNRLSVERVIEMVSNQTNYCSEEYLRKLRNALEGAKLYLESFGIDQDMAEKRGLEKEQLGWLGKLGNKMKELSERNGEEYKKRVKPTKEWQKISEIISTILKRELDFSENGVEEIELLLCQLPIFEMLKAELRESKNVKLPWVIATIKHHYNFQLMDEQDGIRIAYKHNSAGAVVTNNALDNNLVYSLTCTFNKPFPGDKEIYIGLFQDERINSAYQGGQNKNSGFISLSDYTDKEIIKGQLLNCAPTNTNLTVLHFRLCIATQSFFFADEKYTNINKSKPNYFNKDGKYRFGVQFNQPGEGYSCCISNVKTYLDQRVVDSF